MALKQGLNLFLLADLHLGSERHTTAAFHHALVNMRHLDPDAAVVIAGDITDTGEKDQFQDCWKSLDRVPAEQLIVGLGNHDVRGPDPLTWNNDQAADPEYFRQNVLPEYSRHYLRRLKPDQPWQPYFSQRLGDYQFIVLNTEKGLKDSAYLSAAQVRWLDAQLQAGENSGCINIVLSHQPLRDTHWRSNFGGGFGLQDAVVKDVLRRHPNTFIVSGHIHNGFGVAEVIPRSYGTCIDLPAFALSENGRTGSGLGYYCTWTHDAMKFEAWDFAINRPLAAYDFTLKTTTLAAAMPDLSVLHPESAQHALQLLYRSYDTRLFDDPRTDQHTAPPVQSLFGPEVQAQIQTLLASAYPRPAQRPPIDLRPYHGYFAQRDEYVAAIERFTENLAGDMRSGQIEAQLTRQFVAARLNLLRPQLARFDDATLKAAVEEAQHVLVGVFPRVDFSRLQALIDEHAAATSAELQLALNAGRYLIKDHAATQPAVDGMIAEIKRLVQEKEN